MKEKEKIKPIKYLNIRGNLSADNKIVLQPSYLISNSTGIKNFEESLLKINLYKDEILKLQWGANLGTRTYPKPSEIKNRFKNLVTGETLFVKTKIPFPEGTNRIDFVYKNIKIHEINVAAEKPKFEEEETRIEKKDEETYRVCWKVSHPETTPLYFNVRTSADGGTNWRGLASEITTNEITLKEDSLVGGKDCIIEIMAYNNVNTVTLTRKVPDTKPIQLIAKILSQKLKNETISPPVKLRSYCYLTGKKVMEKKPKFTWKINDRVIAETQNAILYELEPGEYGLDLNVQWGDMKAKDSIKLKIEDNNKFRKLSQMRAVILEPKQQNEIISLPFKLRSYCYLPEKKAIEKNPRFTWKINNEVIAETQNTILYEIEPGEYELELSVQWEKMEAKDSIKLIIKENSKFS